MEDFRLAAGSGVSGTVTLPSEESAEAALGLQRAAPRELPHDDVDGRLSWSMRGLQGVRRQDRDLLLKMAGSARFCETYRFS